MFYWRGIVKIIIRSRRWGGVIGSSTFRNGQSAQRWRRQALTTEAKRSSGSFATAGHPLPTCLDWHSLRLHRLVPSLAFAQRLAAFRTETSRIRRALSFLPQPPTISNHTLPCRIHIIKSRPVKFDLQSLKAIFFLKLYFGLGHRDEPITTYLPRCLRHNFQLGTVQIRQ